MAVEQHYVNNIDKKKKNKKNFYVGKSFMIEHLNPKAVSLKNFFFKKIIYRLTLLYSFRYLLLCDNETSMKTSSLTLRNLVHL